MWYNSILVVYLTFLFLIYTQAKSFESIDVSKLSKLSEKVESLRNTPKKRTSMPKLYFRHGAVSSAKTLSLLAVAHSYRQQGKEVLLMKPAMDSRFGADIIKSRAGLESDADVLIEDNTDLLSLKVKDVYCVLVDECQFLSKYHIDQLRKITAEWKVPVICYGLRTDFRTNLFPGSQRLLELADTIEEVKTTCFFCNRKAVFNLKHVDGRADVSGPAVQLGAEEKYFPSCFECYTKALDDVGQPFPFKLRTKKFVENEQPIDVEDDKENNTLNN